MADSTRNEDDRRGVLLTLDRGIRVLEEIARQGGEATAKTVSPAVGVNLGTCYQILRTLYVSGYVTRLPGSRYSLGPRVAFLLDHYDGLSAPPPELSEILRDLRSKLAESVYCSLRRGARLEIAAVLEGTRAVRVAPMHVGFSEHLHARASGKCFLAYLDQRELETFVSKDNLEPVTANTITDWGEFLEELDLTRERGFALDDEEFNDGVACIGSVLLGRDGLAMGAFTASLPIDRLEKRQEELVPLMVDAGRRGSQALGYEGPYPPPA